MKIFLSVLLICVCASVGFGQASGFKADTTVTKYVKPPAGSVLLYLRNQTRVDTFQFNLPIPVGALKESLDAMRERIGTGGAGVGATVATDTTDLKQIDSVSVGDQAYLQKIGSSGVGAGYFVLIDSTYAEGVYAFDATTQGKQWVRTEYLEKPNTINALWAGTIQRAISSAKAKMRIEIPAGEYISDTCIVVNKDSIEVVGAGVGVTVLRKTVVFNQTTLNSFFKIVGRGITVSNISVDMGFLVRSGDTGTGNGILVSASSGVTVKDCEVRGITGHTYGIWTINSSNVDIIHNRVSGDSADVYSPSGSEQNQEGIEVAAGTCNDVRVAYNTVTNISNCGILVYNNPTTKNVSLTNNNISHSKKGIHFSVNQDVGVYDFSGLSASFNQIDTCSIGIILTGPPSYTTKAKYFSVTNNILRNCPDGISVQFVRDGQVSNNQLYDCGGTVYGAPIQFSGGQSVDYKNNIIVGSDSISFGIIGSNGGGGGEDPASINIVGNTIKNAGAGGIYLTSIKRGSVNLNHIINPVFKYRGGNNVVRSGISIQYSKWLEVSWNEILDSRDTAITSYGIFAELDTNCIFTYNNIDSANIAPTYFDPITTSSGETSPNYTWDASVPALADIEGAYLKIGSNLSADTSTATLGIFTGKPAYVDRWNGRYEYRIAVRQTNPFNHIYNMWGGRVDTSNTLKYIQSSYSNLFFSEYNNSPAADTNRILSFYVNTGGPSDVTDEDVTSTVTRVMSFMADGSVDIPSLGAGIITAGTIGTSGSVNVGGNLTLGGAFTGAISMTGAMTVGSTGEISAATTSSIGFRANPRSDLEIAALTSSGLAGNFLYAADRQTFGIWTGASTMRYFMTRDEFADSIRAHGLVRDTSGANGGKSFGALVAAGKAPLVRWSPTTDTLFADSASGTGGGSGETNTASNLGGGLANYDSKSGVDLRFNSFASADFDLASNLFTIDGTKWATLAAVAAAYQPLDADLTYLSGFTPTANVKTILNAADYAAVRTALGLVISTNVQAYDADLTTWSGVTPGTGVGTALAVNVGTAGAFVVNGGALGTPSSGTLTNCTFPTLNQNTTGSSAKWTTARSLFGNSVDGTADITAIIASTYGGTGNGFTKFTGPTTSEKTFTLPNASATILTDQSATNFIVVYGEKEIPASAWKTVAGDLVGATPVADDADNTNDFTIEEIEFSASAKNYICYTASMPPDWDGTTAPTFKIYSYSAGSHASQTAAWDMACGYVRPGTDSWVGALGTAVEVTQTYTTANVWQLGSKLAPTPAGTAAAGAEIKIRIYRDGDDATNDTFTSTTRITKVIMQYKKTKYGNTTAW